MHFSYGMVELPNGKMKSREGTVVDADDLMDKMVEDAREISKDKVNTLQGITEQEADEIARKVGLGALKYFILKVDPRKNMLFNPAESIDFNGNTGPFIQYTYARIQSVLRKAGADAGQAEGILDFSRSQAEGILDHCKGQTESILDHCKGQTEGIQNSNIGLDGKELALIQRLCDYPAVVRNAGDNFSPALICNYAYDLACDFNSFYHDLSILNEPDSAKRALRLLLAKNVAKVLASAMSLLGIEMPERM